VADFNPIVQKPQTTLDLVKLGRDIAAVLQTRGVNFTLPQWAQFHTSYSKGPNGPAVLQSVGEILLLPK